MTTARPQPMLIERYVPFACPERTTWVTTPEPNTISTKVPRNSAAASRAVPFFIPRLLRVASCCKLLRAPTFCRNPAEVPSALHPRARPGDHELARHPVRSRRRDQGDGPA